MAARVEKARSDERMYFIDYDVRRSVHYFEIASSVDSKKVYHVRLAGNSASCTCNDCAFRSRRCKHIIRTLIYRFGVEPSKAARASIEKSLARGCITNGERCPICYEELADGHGLLKKHCQQCRHAMHSECYDQLCAHTTVGAVVKCPLCNHALGTFLDSTSPAAAASVPMPKVKADETVREVFDRLGININDEELAELSYSSTNEQAVENFLIRRCDCVELSMPLTKAGMCSIGFRPEVAQEVADEANLVTSAATVADQLIIAVCRIVPLTPLPPWLQGSSGYIQQPPMSDTSTIRCAVGIIRTSECGSRDKLYSAVQQLAAQCLPPSEVGRTLFHGTGMDAALSIIERGVNPNRGNIRQDFSNSSHRGYYVGTSLALAFDRARSRKSANNVGAVVIHHFPPDVIPTVFNGEFILRDDSWSSVVRSCRDHDIYPTPVPWTTLPPCIAGKMSAIGHVPFADGRDQLCVLSHDLALQFNHYTVCVLFITF